MADTQHGKSQPETVQSPATPAQEVSEEPMGITRYLLTRLSTLKPPMNPAPNPIKALLLLNTEQWLFFLVCMATVYLAFLTL